MSLEQRIEHEKVRQEEVGQHIEELALRASYMPTFQKIINDAPGKGQAIVEVRKAIKEHLPEVYELPEPEVAAASNEFMLAKAIVGLLWS